MGSVLRALCAARRAFGTGAPIKSAAARAGALTVLLQPAPPSPFAADDALHQLSQLRVRLRGGRGGNLLFILGRERDGRQLLGRRSCFQAVCHTRSATQRSLVEAQVPQGALPQPLVHPFEDALFMESQLARPGGG